MERMMKESGVEWIGQIPESWYITKFNHVIERMSTGLNPRDNFELGKGDNYYVTIRNFKNGHLFLDEKCDKIDDEALAIIHQRSDLKVGDILFASISKEGNTYLIEQEPVNWEINESVFTIRADKKFVIPRFLNHVLVSKYFFDALQSEATGSTFQSIKQEKMRANKIVLPPIEEQEKIATFLDEKVKEIDAIISKTEETIEQYKKYRNSIISEKIIFGMDSSAPVKNTGVAWCPQIPEHWNVINPKALFSLRKDKAREGDRQLTASQKKGIMYQDEYMESEGVRVVVVQKDFDILKHVEPDDFVISMRSFQGGLEYSELSGCISSAYVMLIPNKEKVYSPFYKWFFKSSKYINAIQSTSNLVRDGQAMRYSNFAQVPLLDIPMEEQQKIAEYLSEKCAEIDALIAKKEAFVEEMEAYKKSLIYEYVTGKKEVL